MDSKYLLIRGITLLFLESKSGAPTNSGALVDQAAKYVELPDVRAGVADTERDTLLGLKGVCKYLGELPKETPAVAADIIQRIKLFIHEEVHLIQSLQDAIETEYAEDQIMTVCMGIRREINEYVRERKAKDLILEASRIIKYKPDDIVDLQKFVMDLRGSLEVYETNSKEKDPAIVSSLNMGDLETAVAMFNQAKELNDSKGIMRSGSQGFNRMTAGGVRRGEEVVCGAGQHNFKSGWATTLFRHIPMYNTPYMIDETKKPLVLRFSFEDPLHITLPFLYQSIWENEHRVTADLRNTSAQDMAAYIDKNLRRNGYHYDMIHVNPSLWTFRDIQDKVLEYEAQGYEIHFLSIDYLSLIPTTGCTDTGATGTALRDLFRRIKNFCAQRKICFYTPHQHSSEAKNLLRAGLEDTYVQEIANKGFWDGARSIDQEIDLEFHIHIVKFDGRKWLTFQRGKHRGIGNTKECDMYFVLPIEEIGVIIDDVDGEDTTRKKPGGNPIGSKADKPYWDVD